MLHLQHLCDVEVESSAGVRIMLIHIVDDGRRNAAGRASGEEDCGMRR